MFGNKKKSVEEKFNPTIFHFKELWNNVSEAHKSIYKSMLIVITREEIIRFYPKGADKEIAIKRFEEAQNKFRNTIAAYDIEKNELFQYYEKRKNDISSKLSWNPYQWKERAEVVEFWYRHIKGY